MKTYSTWIQNEQTFSKTFKSGCELSHFFNMNKAQKHDGKKSLSK